MQGRYFQYSLIGLSLAVTGFVGLYFLRELFPEYRLYQKAYVALEHFRAEKTHSPPSAFQFGVKQIVLPQPNNAPEIIDRCISCHVALDVESYSPTRLQKDVNGVIMRDEHGVPLKAPNENYIFKLLDDDIAASQDDPKRLAQLKAMREVEHDGRIIDLSKVLVMHPLMGREERPFQFHSVEEIGCTSCHNGNGRALTSDKAHGPVFDGMYEPAFEGIERHFLEKDLQNDPPFSKVFNNKPGHALLFQTTPLFVGGLIEANCIQCHLNSQELLDADRSAQLNKKIKLDQALLESALEADKQALNSLLFLEKQIAEQGVPETLKLLSREAANPEVPSLKRRALRHQKKWLETLLEPVPQELQKRAAEVEIQRALIMLLGTPQAVEAIKKLEMGPDSIEKTVQDTKAGQIYTHIEALNKLQQGNHLLEIDRLTPVYQLGKEEYFWQACYACHRISGLSRGGVGPDLTQEGFVYPWFIKFKLRDPQGSFAASRMPNMHLDHTELEALTTFLLAQKGKRPVISDIDYKNSIKAWDEGKKQPWEAPLPPGEIRNLNTGLKIFATEGCAACHRLRGFTSSVGFSSEADPNSSWEDIEEQREWFQDLIPELIGSSDIPGSLLVQKLKEHGGQIDQNILANAKEEGLLDQLNREHPELLFSFYSPFAYAMRAQNDQLQGAALAAWQNRVMRVALMYMQEYGFGRLIGPRLNWSGIFRSNAWLMQHFYDPAGMVPGSLMPNLRFDATKFAALTYMLEEIGRRNLQEDRMRWDKEGFQPQAAYALYCAQCHGPSERRDEAPLLQWIYPIPKNLRNSTFLGNLTRPRIIESILHGVKGTPMPPWGEIPQDKSFDNNQPLLTRPEVEQLVDWLLRSVPTSIKEQNVPKWQYTPQDVLEDLKREKETLKAEHFEDLLDEPPLLASADVAYLGAPAPKEEPLTVETLFEVRDNPIEGGLDQKGYYIQQRFATPANLAAGQRFFVENCAVCHGVEGGGDGPRALEMYESKPRILTNIHWLDTRDDLRLLRSIKYGVPGTSMVAWGDATTMRQRLQLVLYIRHLSEQLKMRDALTQGIYDAFEVPTRQLETAPSKKAPINKLMALLNQEKTVVQTLGSFLINASADPRIWQQFVQMLKGLKQRYRIEEGNVVFTPTNTLEQSQGALKNLFSQLESEQKVEETKLKGQFNTPKQRRLLTLIAAKRQQLAQTQDEFLSAIFELKRLQTAAQETVKK